MKCPRYCVKGSLALFALFMGLLVLVPHLKAEGPEDVFMRAAAHLRQGNITAAKALIEPGPNSYFFDGSNRADLSKIADFLESGTFVEQIGEEWRVYTGKVEIAPGKVIDVKFNLIRSRGGQWLIRW